MDWLTSLFTSSGSAAHVIFVYALVIALGSQCGRIKIAGVSLGVTAVFFVGIAFGWLGFSAPDSILNFMRDFGLALFVYFVGLQVGPSFFSSFRSGGLLLNLLTAVLVLLSILVTVALFFMLGGRLSLPQMLGVHFGAVTNTPGLGAAQEMLDMLHYSGESITVAYACAYPLGVLGTILAAKMIRRLFRIDLAQEDREWENSEKALYHEPISFSVESVNKAFDGLKLGEIRSIIGRPFVCSRLLSEGRELSPNANSVIRTGEVLRIVAAPEHKAPIAAFFGKLRDDVTFGKEDSPLVSRMILITRSRYNGVPLKDLRIELYEGLNVTRVIRSGMTLFPYSGMHLQVGDQIVCTGPEASIHRLEVKLGNKSARLSIPNTFTIFIGLAIGMMIGSIPIPIPGIPGTVRLGLAGGSLIAALFIGRYGSLAKLISYTTESANLMMRDFGITIFLASIGIAAGPEVVDAMVNGNGLLYVALGLLITVIPVLAVGIAARRFFRLNYHSILGLLAGATTDSPALLYASSLSRQNSAAVAYSTVYPLSLLLRILTGQLILLFLWPFAAP